MPNAIRRDREYYCEKITTASTADQVDEMLELAQQLELSCIGVDGSYSIEPMSQLKNELLYDIRSMQPKALALVFVETRGRESSGFRFLVDVSTDDPQIVRRLQELFRLPVKFVGYRFKSLLFCLWSLDLAEPDQVWDTQIFERCAFLGRVNVNRRAEQSDYGLKNRLIEQLEYDLELTRLCQRYGIDFQENIDSPWYHDRQDEPESLTLERAIAAAQLYFHQLAVARKLGITDHLLRVEMPWVITNARMEWTGVKVDQKRCQQIREAYERHSSRWEKALEAAGISNINSQHDVARYFHKEQLLDPFRHNKRYSFSRDTLKEFKHLPQVQLIYKARQVADLPSEKILNPNFIAADGRVHPQHKQLSAETGRQGARHPNVLGLSRLLRTVIVPEPRYGIGEVDLSQMEIGIAAAVYHDDGLIEAFNSGDVYCAMAKRFYSGQLGREDLELEESQFKAKHPEKRDLLKTCTLSIIYGGTERTIARRLGVDLAEAKRLRDEFLEVFPAIEKAMGQGTDLAMYRGYLVLVSGMRIAIDPKISETAKRRLCMNYPIQGSATVVFKAAGNRLDRLYRRYGARLIIPLHDSYVFEAPLEVLDDVAELTRRVMCETVGEFFPVLEPRAEMNIAYPHCWNKDGDVDAFSQWVEEGKL